MKVSLRTNIASLQAQGKVNKVTGSLSSSFEKLSTGLRINKAGDDPAGLQVADQLQLQSALYSKSVQNIQQGISMISILDAGLEQQANILQRMSSLAAQSANGVYGFEQRAALQAEYQELMEEFDRIAETTRFNDINLLKDNSDQSTSLMIGIDGSADSRLMLEAITSHSLSGVVGTRSDFSGSGFVDVTDLNRYGIIANQAIVPAQQNGFMQQRLSITDSLGDTRNILIRLNSLGNDFGANAANINSAPYTPISDLGFIIYEVGSEGSLDYILPTGGPYSTPVEGMSQQVTFSDTGATATVELDYSETTLQHLDDTNAVYTLVAGVGTVVENATVRPTAIGFTGIEFQETAVHALTVLENRLEDHNALRGKVGAVQSRLESAVTNALSLVENYATAESVIRDADIATETAEFVRLQIIQQASVAVLGQANALSSSVLQLLA